MKAQTIRQSCRPETRKSFATTGIFAVLSYVLFSAQMADAQPSRPTSDTTTASTYESATYKERSEAYGHIVGTYWSALAVAEVCGQYPSLHKQSQTATKVYIALNGPLYDEITSRMQKFAIDHGGESAVKELHSEIRASLSDREFMMTQARKAVPNESACSSALTNLVRGDWLIPIRNKGELALFYK